MSSLEAPTIDSFVPDSSYRALGVGYVTLLTPDGVRLDLSEAGVEAVDQSPETRALLTRMAAFVAEHGFFKATLDIPDREPCDIPRVSESWIESYRWGRKNRRLASVYHPDRVPGVILKAHDYRRVNAGLQFYLGAWLHESLKAADIGIDSPAQLGMMRAPGARGHKTVIMDHVPGRSLTHWVFTYGNSLDEEFLGIVKNEAEEVIEATQAKLEEALDWRGRRTINDLNGTNIMLADPEEVTLDSVAAQELTIIDQPSARTLELPGLAAARYAPLLRARHHTASPIENPATSS